MMAVTKMMMTMMMLVMTTMMTMMITVMTKMMIMLMTTMAIEVMLLARIMARIRSRFVHSLMHDEALMTDSSAEALNAIMILPTRLLGW